MHPATRKAPQEKTIHRAKRKLSARRPVPCPCYVVEDPRKLGRGKIRIQPQAGFLHDRGLDARVLQLAAMFRRAAILPDDRLVNALAGFPVPDERGFPLIGNANTGDHLRTHAAGAQRIASHKQHRLPDVFRIVLHPARLRKLLWELLLGTGNRFATGAKNYAAAAAGSLVNCKYERLVHGVSCPG